MAKLIRMSAKSGMFQVLEFSDGSRALISNEEIVAVYNTATVSIDVRWRDSKRKQAHVTAFLKAFKLESKPREYSANPASALHVPNI